MATTTATSTAPTNTEASPTQAAEAEVTALETKIKLLTDLRKRVNDLRQVPGHLLRPQPALSSVLPIPQSEQTRLRDEFEQIKLVSENLRSAEAQEALTLAKDSEAKDKNGLSFNKRRLEQSTQPTGAATPESPQPYPSFQPISSSLFPPWDNTTAPLNLEGLPDYIRGYNRAQHFRLHVWSYRRRTDIDLVPPVIVRFIIRDVLTVYVTLDAPSDGRLITESATAFGPREEKPPHSQSDYIVYQNLSQQLAKIVQSQPHVPFQQVVSLLESYADLFVRRCSSSSCQRVVSLEGHVPPVGRVWVSDPPGQGHWDARHATCPRH